MDDETKLGQVVPTDLMPSAVDASRTGPMRRTVVRMSREDLARFDKLRALFPGRSRAALIRAFCVTVDTAPQASHFREDALTALAEVMSGQASLARAEAGVLKAGRRLNQAVTHFITIVRSENGTVDVPPLAADAILFGAGSETRPAGTLRDRVVDVMSASPEQEFTPAILATALGEENRNTIRNTLLFLANHGRIEKLGHGRYRARAKPQP
jgi:hypothetical protein